MKTNIISDKILKKHIIPNKFIKKSKYIAKTIHKSEQLISFNPLQKEIICSKNKEYSNKYVSK